MFKKRHFIALASLIKHTREYSPGMQIGIDFFSNELIKFFETDNPKFKPLKFKKACGIEQGQK